MTCLLCCATLMKANASICCTKGKHYVCADEQCKRGFLDQGLVRGWKLPCSRLGLRDCEGLFTEDELKEVAKELEISLNQEDDVTPPPATLEQNFFDLLNRGALVECPHCGISTQKDDACMHMHCTNCNGGGFCFCCGRKSTREGEEGFCPRGVGGCDAINCYLEKNPNYSSEVKSQYVSDGEIALEQFYIWRTMWFLKLFCFTLKSPLEILQLIILLEKNEIQGNIYSLAQILLTAPPLYGDTTECEIVIPTILEKSHIHKIGIDKAFFYATIIQKYLRGAFIRNRYDYLRHCSSDWNPVCSTNNCNLLCSIVPKTLGFYDTCCRSCCDTSCVIRPICTTSGCNRPRAPIRRSDDFHPKCSLTCHESLPGGEFNYSGYRHWLKVSRT